MPCFGHGKISSKSFWKMIVTGTFYDAGIQNVVDENKVENVLNHVFEDLYHIYKTEGIEKVFIFNLIYIYIFLFFKLYKIFLFFYFLFLSFSFKEMWDLFPESFDFLTRVKDRGISLGIISNNDERLVKK